LCWYNCIKPSTATAEEHIRKQNKYSATNENTATSDIKYTSHQATDNVDNVRSVKLIDD
jgi:hypothetical protein